MRKCPHYCLEYSVVCIYVFLLMARQGLGKPTLLLATPEPASRVFRTWQLETCYDLQTNVPRWVDYSTRHEFLPWRFIMRQSETSLWMRQLLTPHDLRFGNLA